MRIGDIVTITTNKPYGVVDKYPVKNETGVIVELDESTDSYRIKTGNPHTTGWWYSADEFRLATDDEIKARLRFVLRKWG